MINDYYLSKPDNFQEQTHLFLDDFDHRFSFHQMESQSIV